MADVVVVMTDTACRRLLAGFDVDADKVIVIPHGAATPPQSTSMVGAAHRRGAGHRPRLLTWGLLGPGKGIEWAIDAFAELADLDPAPTYVIAGATHPKVREHAGEEYREMLVDRAERSGSGPSVSFDDSYRDLEALTDLIRSADLVVLPYDSADQVTSGVLVDAVAAGCPVVSTAFPHAVELLASGAGIVVPQRDPAALAAAIRTVLTDTDRADAMAAEARRLAPELSWEAVGATVRRARRALVDRAAGRRTGAGMNVIPLAPLMPAQRAPMLTAWRHVLTMTDAVGIFEHADFDVPRLDHGYCTDDVARLLIAIVPRAGPRSGTQRAGPDLPAVSRGIAGCHGAHTQPTRRQRTLAWSARCRGLLGAQRMGIRQRRSPRS